MLLDPSDFRQRTRFVIRLGRALHECGASSERIERHLKNVTTMLGLNGSFLVSPTTFTCGFWEEDEMDQLVHIERVETADYNLGLLWEIDSLVEEMDAGNLGFSEAAGRLTSLRESPLNYGVWTNALSWLVTGGAFSLLLSPSLANAVTAAVLSVLISLILRWGRAEARWRLVTSILGAMVAGIGSSLVAAAGWDIQPPLVVLSAIIIMIPGLAVTVSLTEISSGHLISGCSRLADALMSLLKLFFGALTGVTLVRFFNASVPDVLGGFRGLPELPDWRIWPALFGLAGSFGIGLNLPLRRILWGAIALVVAFVAAKLGERHFGVFAGIFLGALAVGLYANAFSRLTRGPSSVLITNGIIVLVPGSRVYSMMNEWVAGESILPPESGATALFGFVSLTAGLLFANAFMPTRKSL